MLDVHFEHLLLVDSRGGVTAVTAAPSLAWILPVCGPATVGLYEDSILVILSTLAVLVWCATGVLGSTPRLTSEDSEDSLPVVCVLPWAD